ncbi:MAG: hypothetical protein HQ546_06905 [Planctomycetes bacterium]|nr:hypothetical protein [Planctomycetota bacterium]
MTDDERFSRAVDPVLVEDLKHERLFNDCLLRDIQSGDWKTRVFPAIRRGRIDFYYSGGKLFSYSRKTRFTTHVKYASVLSGIDRTYVSESHLSSATVVNSFRKGYERIKANCAMYAGVEAQGLANAHKRSSFAVCNDDVVVLDIEVALMGRDDAWEATPDWRPKAKSSRIDLLLYNKANGLLRFYEGKHYSNPELWAASGRKPKVVDQLRRYNSILARKERRSGILDAYVSCASTMNDLCGVNLPVPKDVEDSVVLFVFGYDSHQEARIEELILSDDSLKGFRFRQRGDTADGQFSARVLWQKVKQC